MNNIHRFSRNILTLSIAATVSMQASAELEEVVVTAQKRAQSVNDIGVSASAISGDQLNDLGITEMTDLGAHTPGLVTVNSTSGGTTIFAIRGIGLDDFSPNNTSGVGVYTDEVFASNPAFLTGRLYDVERVEVLKGPQGTLYGKNTTGGAISFISNKPTDELEGYADISYGNYNTFEFTGAVGGALADNLRGRIAFNMADGDGWQDDIQTGDEFGSQERHAIRGILDTEFGDSGTLELKAYYTSDESTPVSPEVDGLADFFGDASFGVLDSPKDADEVTAGGLDVMRDESGHGVSATVNYSFENFDFVSISAYDRYDREVVDNYGGSAAAILDLYQDNEMSQWSQEFRFISNGDDSFTWVAGINISNERVEVEDRFDDSFFLTPSGDGTNATLDPADVGVRGWDLLTANYEQETDSYGVYFHSETQLSDNLTFIGGVRYSYDDRSFDGVSTNHDDVYSFNDVVTTLDESQSESAVTGKIGLEWDAIEDVLIYGSISNSYKSGAYYGAAILDDVSWAYVDPEEVIAYEVGFKATLLDNTLQVNGAAFYLEYTDRQSLVSIIVDDFSNALEAPIVDTTLINVPESTTQGFELDVDWAPNDAFFLRAGVSYLDTEVTKAPTTAEMRGIEADPSVNDGANGTTIPFVDSLAGSLEKGADLSQAPQLSLNALAAYTLFLDDDMKLRFQTSYSSTDQMVAQLADANAESETIKSLDAQITLSNEASMWAVTAWAKNLNDNDSESYSFSSFAGRSFYRQTPLTYGVSFRYDFY